MRATKTPDKKKAKFGWTTEQQTGFEDLKSETTPAHVLVPYRPERNTGHL